MIEKYILITGSKGKTMVNTMLYKLINDQFSTDLNIAVNSSGSFRNNKQVSTYEDSIINYGKSPNVKPGRYLYWNLKKNDNSSYKNLHAVLEASFSCGKVGTGIEGGHDVGILTNIMLSHTNNEIQTLQDTYNAKSFIFNKLKDNGWLFTLLDDEYAVKSLLEDSVRAKKINLVGITKSEENFEKYKNICSKIYLYKDLNIHKHNESINISSLPLIFNGLVDSTIYNYTFAIAVADSYLNIPLQNIVKSLENFDLDDVGRLMLYSDDTKKILFDYAHETNSLHSTINLLHDLNGVPISIFYRLSTPTGDVKEVIDRYVEVFVKNQNKIKNIYLYNTRSQEFGTGEFAPFELIEKLKNQTNKSLPNIKIELLNSQNESLQHLKQEENPSLFIWNNLEDIKDYINTNNLIKSY